MKDLAPTVRLASDPIDAGLPETLEEAEELAASIERAVQRETAHQIRNLTVEVDREGVRLRGHCATYYCKQLAQHVAMAGGRQVTNSIQVS